MQAPARALDEPVVQEPGLVRGGVVEHEVHVQVGGHRCLDLIQKARNSLARWRPLQVVLLGSRSRWRWFGLDLGTAAFALTLHRSAWIGLLLGAAWITLLRDRRARFTIAAAVLPALLAIPLMLASLGMKS